jgi:hypothetical protein
MGKLFKSNAKINTLIERKKKLLVPKLDLVLETCKSSSIYKIPNPIFWSKYRLKHIIKLILIKFSHSNLVSKLKFSNESVKKISK